MNALFIAIIVVTVGGIKADDIFGKIKSYFDCDVVKSFENKWQSYRYSYENTIAASIRGDYGHKTMNVYINRFHKPLMIATGYYHTDNQVNLVFRDMMLEALPHLYDVDISFLLPSNVLQVEASVKKMILHTSYVLFRNQSDIIFSPSEQDPYKSSPFRFQQVRNTGDLAITIEGCSMSGIVVATLSGNSVILGHHELRLKDCQFSIEIYKLGSGTPPVIANYLPSGDKGLNIEKLLTRPMLEELVPKLQGAMFADVNTSAIFTNDLAKIRAKQEIIFEDTKNFMDELVRNMNKKSLEKNMGTIELGDFALFWDDSFTEMPTAKVVKLTTMTLLGLDTAYLSHTGGPVRLTETEIIEQLRFSNLQVTGKVSIDDIKNDSDFAVEISDLAVDLTIDLNRRIKFEVLGWRFLEFSCPDLEFLPIEPSVVGYLLNEVPKHIKLHLSSVYDGEVKLSQEYGNEYLAGDVHHGVESHEVYAKQVLNQNASGEHIKLHHILVKPHEEEQDIVQLNDPETGDRLHLKLHNADPDFYNPGDGLVQLHNVEAEPHEEDKGIVKLHHIETENHKEEQDIVKLIDIHAEPYNEEPDEIKTLSEISQLNKAETKDNIQVKLLNAEAELHRLDDGLVQLHHVEAAPHKEESGILKLNHVEAEPHKEESGVVKLHHVEAELPMEESGIVKLHHIETEPHRPDPGLVQVLHVDVVPDDGTNKTYKGKTPKQAARAKLNRKIFTKTSISKRPIKNSRQNRRVSNVSMLSLRASHTSDNEILSQ